LNAIDPGVCQAPDGTLWISYGSYHGNIELVELDPVTGLRIATNSPVSIIASQSEASDIIFHQGYYYLFVNHGSCCAGANSTYNIRVGRTQKITGPYLDKYGEDLARGAGTLFLAASGKQIGPGHFGFLREDGVEKFSCHYEANLEKGGRSMLDLRPLLWSADGWPLAGENVPDGTYQVRSLRTGTVLQAPGNATNGNRGLTARYLVQAGQKWVISAAGSGYCKIASTASTDMDKALEESEGGAVAVAPFVGDDRQLWKLDQVSDGSYRIASKADKLALTATINIKPGNGIALQAYRGDDSQHWVVAAP
jgi:arabinan endo-1,5-alpha-L-arabinosidase